jgi:hypothetical protein
MGAEVLKVSGSYRQIEAKIQRILLARDDDKSFLTIETQDGSGKVVRYSGMTDIMNFLEKLRKVLIPIEDAENSKNSYGPVRVFSGCRF